MHPNEKKYIVPPSIETIEKVIKSLKISESKFEKLFGLFNGCISHVRMGVKRLPPRHWHLFYEKISIEIVPKTTLKRKKPQEEATPKPTPSSKNDVSTSKNIDTLDPLLNEMLGSTSKPG